MTKKIQRPEAQEPQRFLIPARPRHLPPEVHQALRGAMSQFYAEGTPSQKELESEPEPALRLVETRAD